MDELLAGVARFQAEVFPKERQRFALLANSQAPRALFITCADSRVQPNLITQTEPGELFICRDIGNIVPPYGAVYGGVSATIEYAVSVLDIGHIVVCGHSDCGAMRALVHGEKLAGLPSVEAWLQQAEAARRTVTETHPEAEGEELLDLLIEQNVVTQLANLRTHPAVAARLATNRLEVHGWHYRIETGDVRVYDETLDRFVAPKPLAKSTRTICVAPFASLPRLLVAALHNAYFCETAAALRGPRRVREAVRMRRKASTLASSSQAR